MKKFLYLAILVVVLSLTMVSLVRAAAYNFFFNNTEQGANSTASPTLTVDGEGKATSTGAQQTTSNLMDLGKGGEAKKPVAPEATPALVALAPVSPEDTAAATHFKRVHLGVSGVVASGSLDGLRSGNGSQSGALASFGVWLGRDVGLNAFLGGLTSDMSNHVFGGGELELRAVRVSLFRMDDLLDLSLLAGAGSYQKVAQAASVSPHAGARVNVNLGENWGVGVTGRAIRLSSDAHLMLAEAGVVVRF